jgi:hypothetical protein
LNFSMLNFFRVTRWPDNLLAASLSLSWDTTRWWSLATSAPCNYGREEVTSISC